MISANESLEPPLVLKVGAASRELALSEDEVRRLCHSGELAAFRTAGGHWRIPRESLNTYVERKCNEERAVF